MTVIITSICKVVCDRPAFKLTARRFEYLLVFSSVDQVAPMV